MRRLLEAQAPAKQNASDTINILSGRLQSATLLEDRRAAIQGLRSFAKLYPASVASGALRSLINCLSTDGQDVDTAKVLLETLLMLFNPDANSDEASDDIALWLADEFTQRQENITILLDFLDRQDYYSRLYCLQLITAIFTARPERTQECVHTAPLGVSRLAATLDDPRDIVRTEGLYLLTSLTTSSVELQKLVAFENAFDRILKIINSEGSLTHGGVIVQDCLSLLANLLRLNASNQSFFRETGWMSKIAGLLQLAIEEQNGPDPIADWAAAQRDKNLWGVFAVIRLFLLGGNVGTQVNQTAFWQSGAVFHILSIAVHPAMNVDIKSEALMTCADLIRGNNKLQERFAQYEITIPEPVPPQVNGHARKPGFVRINVIQELLDITLSSQSTYPLDIRIAACECIKAYLVGHGPIRLHFLRRAREGHLSEHREADNILTILLDVPQDRLRNDPYRNWIASIILFHLVFEDYEAKGLAMDIAEGEAEKGEEVVTCIQSLAGNLILSAQNPGDDVVSLGYLMVLCGWLYEDPDGINDFLEEGSNLQSLIQIALQAGPQRALVAGLCTFLLGTVYEFSTKDSPIPRPKLHEVLTSNLSRDQYVDKMTKLRAHPMIRDFEVAGHGPEDLDIVLDKVFVEFIKDNYSRVLRAIDRDPGLEVSVMANGIQKGVSREMVDLLKTQLEDRNQANQKLESQILNLERQLEQEQADHRKAKDSSALEVRRIQTINEHLQRNHEDEYQKLLSGHTFAMSSAEKEHRETLDQVRADKRMAQEETDAKTAKLRERHEAEVEDLKATAQSLEQRLEKLNRDHMQDLQTAHEEYSSAQTTLEARLRRAEERAKDAEERAKENEERAVQARKAEGEKEDARAAAQTELDDLLIVLGDLEEKRGRDKERLKSLGETVSDDEDEEGGGDAEDE